LALNNDELTVEEAVAENVPKKVREELENLRTALQRLQEERHYILPVKTEKNVLRFAVAGDIHTGSLYERYDALHEFYRILEAEGIHIVLLAGDILDGHGMYRGQEFEIYAHGLRRQIKALKEKYPRKPGIRETFITGNHDYSFDKIADVGIGQRIADEMGWEFAGRDQAWIELKPPAGPSYNVGLYHPDGGTAYAISYKSQKFVESIPGGRKPDMVFIGHYHKTEWMPQYRNVEVFQAGCFQSQTPHMARKPTPAHVGGWIIEVVLGKRSNKTSRVKAEFVSFYEPKEYMDETH